MKFWNFINKPEEAELRIEGDIVDDDNAWVYEMFEMAATSPNAFKTELEKVKGKPLTVWIDSYGGNVFAATGIYNALKEHDAPVTVKIDGKAMSAATIIAMAGKEILMSPTSIFMIHNPLTEAYGYASDLRKTADILDEVKESIMNAYELRTKQSRDHISDLMDDESYMSAKTAIKEGFADSMMYEDVEAAPLNFNFNRHKILNSTTESVKKIIELQKPVVIPENTELLKAILALEIEL